MAKNRKSEQKRPKMALKVEPNFASYLTGKDYNKKHLHVNKKRAKENIEKYFYTFKYLNESKLLDQTEKNKLFPSNVIDSFFQSFQFYDISNTEEEEQNKLHIAVDGIERGLSYLQNRYTETSLVLKQVNEFKDFFRMLTQITEGKARDRKAIEFYKMRHRMMLPPFINQHEVHYVAMCRICWGHNSHAEKNKAISGIRHGIKCPYDKSQKERCFEVLHPENITIT